MPDWMRHDHVAAPPKPPAARPERELWRLAKDGRTAAAVLRAHPHGRELIFRVNDELLWSQVYRPGQAAELDEMAERKRDEFRARGWHDAE